MQRHVYSLFVALALCRPSLQLSVTQRPEVRRANCALQISKSSDAVFFVMGGPGSGKGTQCAKLVEQFGFVHLSAGDLLRQEVSSGSEVGLEIARIIEEGQIVKSEVTVGLLRNAMKQCSGPFLVDGFPRSISNLEAFEDVFEPCEMMLFLKLSEGEMEARLLKRGESSGRSDDNAVTIRKRFHTFAHDSMPVVDNMQKRGLLRCIDADGSPDTVFTRICGELGLEPTSEQREEVH